MATEWYEKSGYEAIKIVGGTPDNPLGDKVTYTWDVDGAAEVQFRASGSQLAGKAQPHPVMKAGSQIIVDRVNKTVTIKEVT